MRMILQPEWLIDGTGSDPKTGMSVVIEGEQITSVTPNGEIEPNESDQVLRLDAQTLIPGLINNHVHLVLPGDNTPFVPWVDLQSDTALGLRAASNIATSLRTGVTTVRDCGGRGTIVLDVREAQATGLIPGSRVVSCGWTMTIEGGHTRQFGGEVNGEVAIRQMVRRLASKGADYTKVMASGGGTPGTYSQYRSFTQAELDVIVDESRALGRKVCAHCIATESMVNALNAGVDLMEHATFLDADNVPRYNAAIANRLAESGIGVSPTIAVSREMVDILPDDDPERAEREERLKAQREILSALIELGVNILAGSDAGWRATAFDNFWKEIDELVLCGMTPVAAIHAATGAVATALGRDDSIGTIMPGKLADLVVVDGDASQDISCLRAVHTVIQSGTVAHQRA
jgi:imidazolonepropionase-like amidohydrolase